LRAYYGKLSIEKEIKELRSRFDGQWSKEGLQSILEAIEEERGMPSNTQYDGGRPIEAKEQQ